MDIFEQATRKAIRFASTNGNITTEDLWNLSLEKLDVIAIAINKQLKESKEESFIKTKSNENSILDLKLEIVKHIINVKIAEKEQRENDIVIRQKRAEILEELEKKKKENLSTKTVEELEAELEKLKSK